MYVTSILVESIRAIDEVQWAITLDQAPGWHTILGVNASGKSTLIKSVAAALIGPRQCLALKQDWKSWIRQGSQDANIYLEVCPTAPWDECEKLLDRDSIVCALNISANFSIRPFQGSETANKYVWSNGVGFFSAGFGPFRRFSGGGIEFEKELEATPLLARHISAFDERASLSSALEWIRQQYFVSLETSIESQNSLVQTIREFVNQDGFLPGGAKLSLISSAGIEFTDSGGAKVNVLEMSDGFRSILSLAFELIRLLHRTFPYPETKLFSTKTDGLIVVDVPGVVLIDEVDAHLHPTWQRTIGPWFTKHFPKMQFIVTTHSPFVCQASSNGTIFVLTNEGDGVSGRFLEGRERDRILYGDILDAYSTEIFGGGITRSEESKEKFSRLSQLNSKALFHKLSESEVKEQIELQQLMSPDSIPIDNLFGA
jgi:AAA domain, putative AbiEii toxin, Type IV TA system